MLSTRRFFTWRRTKILLVFGAVAVVFLGPATLGNKVLSQADLLYFFPPWSACRPTTLLRPSNGLLADQSFQFYPYREFARRQLQEGHVPLWNPFILMGAPFLANMQSAVFSPFHIFSYVGDLKRSFAWSALSRLLVAGVGMYYWCRLLAVSEVGAILAGISFMLCAFHVVWLNHPHTNVSILLPWAFVAIEKIVTHGNIRSALFMAIVIAALFFGGHPETVLHIALGTGVFFLYRIGRKLHKERRADMLRTVLTSAAGGVLLGVGLAAIVLVPFVELLSQSGVWEARGDFTRNPFVLQLSTLLTAVAPDLFGNPAHGSDYGPSNYNERIAYAGFLPLLLAVLSLRHWRLDPRAQFFGGWGLFCFAVIYGFWPIFDVVTLLPIFRHTANHRLLFFWQFCIAVLAGIGVDLVMQSEKRRKDATPKYFLILAAGLSLLPFCLWLVPQLGFVKQNSKTFSGALWPAIMGGAALGLFALFRREKLDPYGWGIAVCVLTFFDLFAVGHTYNPAVNKNRVFHCLPESIRFLLGQEGTFRIAGLEGLTLPANTAMAYGLQDIRGYELPAPRRLVKFFTEGLYGDYIYGAHYELKDLSPQTLRLLSLANVRYVLSTRDLASSYPSLSKVYSGEVQVYENLDVLPRAFVVHQIQVASNEQDALAKIINSKIDLKEVGILEAGDSLVNKQQIVTNPEGGLPSGPCADKIEVVRYEPHRVYLQVDLCQPGVIVLTDTYYTGWKVYLDGVAQHLGRLDYLFRGVYSDSGRHEVQFVYDPLSYKIGLVFSAISGITVLVLLGKSVGCVRIRPIRGEVLQERH
jgi:hypothetical protein